MQGYRFFITLLLILDIYYSTAQNPAVNKYGVSVLLNKNEFLQTVRIDSNKKMVELKRFIPRLQYDLRYASSNNFMKRRMYPANTRWTFMRLAAAKALKEVQTELNEKGMGLKIWDAYRPYSVTVSFWELVGDERYVADPKKGSGHNRGIAVDLTIIELSDRKELDMGTGFDNFSDTAHHDFKNLSQQILSNRNLLKSIMEKHGFISFATEWWHYSLPNATDFEVLDLSFKTLKKLITTGPP
jgi:D-alanyl-D-alanine dipeptidase